MTRKDEEDDATARRAREDGPPTLSMGGDEAATGDRSGSPLPPARDRFASEQVVANRFQIIRILGRGGMGEVYEAKDLELGESVALKTLVLSRDEATKSVDRFRREVSLARKVTHPNVCRIFDVFRHDEDGSDQVVLLLSMELLAGQTLANRLRNDLFSPAEMFPLLRQMAAALSAAHRVGIVHRDFKPDNVMLAPSEEGLRAVVTDFGIAHSASRDGHEALTGTGEVLGTLAYMAPEQVEGKPVTPAADIYALGLVMFEMLTGKRPFGGGSPLVAAVQRLKEKPPSPRVYVPELDERWEKATLRCLERAPDARFAAVDDLIDYLETSDDRPSDRRPTRKLVAGAAVAAILTGVTAFVLTRSEVPTILETANTVVEARRSVAVVGFRNMTGDPQAAWLSTAVSEMLTTELAASEKLRVVSGESVARMKSDLELPESDSFATDTLEKIRQSTGADMVVVGAYTALGEPGRRNIRLDLKLQDANAGETVASLNETGTEPELFALVSALGVSLRQELALGERTDTEARAVASALPSTPEASRAYSEGLEKLRIFDYSGARELLERVVALEPDFPLSHAALAEVWYQLAYERKAVDAAEKAFRVSQNLSREERLFVEARYREVNLEREEAIELYESLWSFFPDNIDYGLRLAALKHEVYARRDQVRETIEALRRVPGNDNDPRIDLAAAELDFFGTGTSPTDEERAILLSMVRDAAQKAQQQGKRRIEARARMIEASLVDALPAELAAYEQARIIYDTVGDRVGVVAALRASATRLRRDEQFDRARGILEQAMSVAREIGADPTVAQVLGSLASVHTAEGDLDEALRYQEEALAVFRKLDSPGDVANANFERAHILRTRGRLPEAEAAFRESLDTCRVMSQGPCIYEALNGIALCLIGQDQLPAARDVLEEALVHTVSIDYWQAIHETRATLSFVLVELGRPIEAEAAAREANRLFVERRNQSSRYAQFALTNSLLAQDKATEARETVSRMTAPSRSSTSWQGVRSHERPLLTDIIVARVNEDTEQLGETITRAEQLGTFSVELEARLAKATLEESSEELGAVERDARAAGYLLIARKAVEARTRR